MKNLRKILGGGFELSNFFVDNDIVDSLFDHKFESTRDLMNKEIFIS